MVYLALGILVITLSATTYRYRQWTYSKKSPSWTPRRSSEKASTASSDAGEEDGKNGEQDDLPVFAIHVGEPETQRLASTEEQTASTAANHSERSITITQPHAAAEGIMLSPAQKTASTSRKLEQGAPKLMPPPSRPNASVPEFRSPPKPSTALRPPPSAASTLRGPPTSSLKPSISSLAPSTSTLAPSARPSRKVLLDPGHSPLDWAHLIANPPTPTFLRGVDVPQRLIRVPPSALRYHNGRKGKNAWGVYQGKVYNLSPYMKFHPGGVDQLMRGAGKEEEGEQLFNEIHPWVSWENMLGECLIGILVSENEVQADGMDSANQMEAMD